MIVCLFAVFFSDYLVFYLGKIFGKNKKVLSIIHRFVSEKSFNRTKLHIQKHSFWVPALFRFTPGIRFPGHFSCGMLGIKRTQFILTDGTAALFSVPTQIFVFAYYGETILSTIAIIKQYFLGVIIVVLLVYIGKKLYKKNKLKKDNI
jgi:membrane protein DedA with SNARE-associated domain